MKLESMLLCKVFPSESLSGEAEVKDPFAVRDVIGYSSLMIDSLSAGYIVNLAIALYQAYTP